MQSRILAASAVVLLLVPPHATAVSVQQIEAYVDSPADLEYAPINFNGSTTVTVTSGNFAGITFHAIDSTAVTGTYSYHAANVGNNFYGAGTSVAHGYVTDVYNLSADTYFNDVVQTASTTGVGVAPGTFTAGVQVVNNSYYADYSTAADNEMPADMDASRRIDFMINRQDVTFVISAVGTATTSTLDWSSFNTLSVSGQAAFNPAGGFGKQHADLYINDTVSYGTATVSGYAAGLYGNAQAAGQFDAEHSVVIRSLLMTGADKTDYTRPTVGALDPVHGAGEPNYAKSVAILQSGEKNLLTVGPANMISGSLSPEQRGWAEGTIAPDSQSVILFQSAAEITGLTASLNWNVTSPQPSPDEIDTSTVEFPDLTLDVRPVTYDPLTGRYVLGAIESDPMLRSDAIDDNVQYLYDTDSLPAGDYAFVISGDSMLPATVGFSYSLNEISPVPEPSVLGMAVIATTAMLRRRKRYSRPMLFPKLSWSQ